MPEMRPENGQVKRERTWHQHIGRPFIYATLAMATFQKVKN
ncbi:MAG: hypothetical protein V1898_01150 [Patescibacteria group bacterium]